MARNYVLGNERRADEAVLARAAEIGDQLDRALVDRQYVDRCLLRVRSPVLPERTC